MTLVHYQRSKSVLASILRLARYLGILVVLGGSYFILAKAGLMLASIHPSATPIWPAAGFALGFVLLCGIRVWPAILLGAFAVNATTEIAGATSTALLATSS